MGIEPTSSAWKAEVLPLNYTRRRALRAVPASFKILLAHQFWWRGEDSNLRRLSRQIYSLLPLATREPLRVREPLPEPSLVVPHSTLELAMGFEPATC